jgi:hypothetical protein
MLVREEIAKAALLLINNEPKLANFIGMGSY